MSARLQAVNTPVLAKKPALRIGCRWRPGQVERRDNASGTFEMVNSRVEATTELLVQRALIGDGHGWLR